MLDKREAVQEKRELEQTAAGLQVTADPCAIEARAGQLIQLELPASNVRSLCYTKQRRYKYARRERNSNQKRRFT